MSHKSPSPNQSPLLGSASTPTPPEEAEIRRKDHKRGTTGSDTLRTLHRPSPQQIWIRTSVAAVEPPHGLRNIAEKSLATKSTTVKSSYCGEKHLQTEKGRRKDDMKSALSGNRCRRGERRSTRASARIRERGEREQITK